MGGVGRSTGGVHETGAPTITVGGMEAPRVAENQSSGAASLVAVRVAVDDEGATHVGEGFVAMAAEHAHRAQPPAPLDAARPSRPSPLSTCGGGDTVWEQ